MPQKGPPVLLPAQAQARRSRCCNSSPCASPALTANTSGAIQLSVSPACLGTVRETIPAQSLKASSQTPLHHPERVRAGTTGAERRMRFPGGACGRAGGQLPTFS